MAPDWIKTKIENIQAVSKGAIAIGPFGSRMKSDCYVETGVPVIRGTNITGGPSFEGNFVFITDEMAESLGSCNVYQGDLVFPHRGAIGEVGIVSNDERYVISSSLMKLTCDRGTADPWYVYYFFKSSLGRHELLKNASQVGTPGIGRPLTSLKGIDIPLPPLSDQKAIAHILGSLDDNIELNRQMNNTLEAMAQALFKSWFVDFDPVIDNALAAGNPIPEPLQPRAEARAALGDQRKPLPAKVQNQFPDRFVFDEEMGWVPEGWEVHATEDISEKIGMGPFGSNIKVSTFVEMGVPVISGQHLHETLLTDENYNYVTKEHALRLKNSMVKTGDIIFTHAGSIGQVSLIPHDTAYPDYVISQRQFYLRPNTSTVSSSYLVYFFRSPIGQHKLLANASQVGVPSIARPSSHLKAIKLLLPTRSSLECFDKECMAIFSTTKSNLQQSDSLTKIRDTLLPQLLSGKLRIPDAEKAVEEALA